MQSTAQQLKLFRQLLILILYKITCFYSVRSLQLARECWNVVRSCCGASWSTLTGLNPLDNSTLYLRKELVPWIRVKMGAAFQKEARMKWLKQLHWQHFLSQSTRLFSLFIPSIQWSRCPLSATSVHSHPKEQRSVNKGLQDSSPEVHTTLHLHSSARKKCFWFLHHHHHHLHHHHNHLLNMFIGKDAQPMTTPCALHFSLLLRLVNKWLVCIGIQQLSSPYLVNLPLLLNFHYQFIFVGFRLVNYT